MTYTVFGSTAAEGLIDQARDLAADAVERVQESVSPQTAVNYRLFGKISR